MAPNIEAIVKKAAQKAAQQAAKQAAQKAKHEQEALRKKEEARLKSKKHRAEMAAEHRRKQEAELREKKDSSGRKLCEEYIAENIAPSLPLLMARDDAKNAESFKIIIRPGRSDHGSYSVSIESSSLKRPIHLPKAELHQMAETQEWKPERILRKLEMFGGFKFSTKIEMLDEILRLRKALKLSHDRVLELTNKANNEPDASPTPQADEEDHQGPEIPQ